MAEQIRNLAVTTLDGSINNSVTFVTVDDASLFPTTGDFQIRVEDEIMRVTGVAGNVFTVTRGYESTTAASHADAKEVAQVWTTVGIDKYRQNYLLTGTLASRPAVGLAGRTYDPTDSLVRFIDTGTEWKAIGPIWKLNIPEYTDYTAYNQGGATFSQRDGEGIYMECPANASQDHLRCLYKTRAAVATGYKLTVAFSMSGVQSNVRHPGVYIFDPIGKRIEGMRVLADSNQAPTKQGIAYTDPANGTPSGLSGNQIIGYFGTKPFMHWIQVEQTGSTTYTWRYSTNGILWYDDYTRNIAGQFANTPTDFLLAMSPYSGYGSVIWRHVKEET